MKKSLAKKITLSILAGAILLSSNVVWAAENPAVSNWYKGETQWGYGWYNWDGPADDDVHEINRPDDVFTYEIYGVWYEEELNPNGTASNGKVTITDGNFKQWICGGYSNGVVESNNNTVIINGGTFNGEWQDITGGYAGSDKNVTDNTVIINGGVFNGADQKVCGGYASDGNATGNIVTITGGIFTGENKVIEGGYSDFGSAVSNTVNISGTANLKDVNLYGGAFWYVPDGARDGIVTAKYGGANDANVLNVNNWGATDNGASNGNRVQNSVKSIQGFDKIHFEYIDWDKDGTVVKVTDKIELATKDDSTGIQGTAVTVGTVNVANGGIEANDEMHLLELTSAGTTIVGDLDELNSSNKVKVNINEGVAKTYNDVDCAISKTANTIDLVIKEALSVVPDEGQEGGTGGDQGGGDNTGGDNTGGNTGGDNTGGNTGGDNTGGNTGGDNTGGDNTGGDNTGGNTGDNTGGDNTGGDNTGEGTLQPSRNNQVLVLGESRAAAVAFTNQGSELIELGLNALARDNSKDTKVFAAVYGNHSEYETGSHVNVNGWSGIVGIGKTNANGLTVGAFFENGEGNYSTHNIFTADYIRGDGEACYNGGGLLVRKDNANGVYAEASMRAGNLQNELRNAVRNGADLTGYDVDTFYYGAHIGIGKVIPRGADGDSLDVYGKFIYTHHDGETFDVGGTPTKFDSVESERLRLGFRLNEVQTNKLSMYYGAAWEYEFNGDAHDKIASFDLETPSLEGSTVIGEIGAHYKASDKWSIDLNGRAYVGQREGFSGSVQANYSF